MIDDLKLKILQYNVMKSRDGVMAPLLRDPHIQQYDILALQEPWRNRFIPTTHNPISSTFHLCFPRDDLDAPARVCFFINKRIDLNNWNFSDHSRDMCSITLDIKCPTSDSITSITIYNVYNPGQHTEGRRSSLIDLRSALAAQPQGESIILGDFNLHHPAWGGPNVLHPEREAEDLLDLTQQFQLNNLLPVGTVTYDTNHAQTCIDQCYATQQVTDWTIRCDIDTDLDHDSDHLPITTIINVPTTKPAVADQRNWRLTDAKLLRQTLSTLLPQPQYPRSHHALDRYMEDIVLAIQSAIHASTPITRHSPRATPGWTRECKETQMEARRLKRLHAYAHTVESWEEYRAARNHKCRVIRRALSQAHRSQVEEASESLGKMWKLAKWARRRGEIVQSKTPTLIDPTTRRAHTSSMEKAELLKTTFFPPPPTADLNDIRNFQYGNRIPFPKITEKEVYKALRSLPQFKAAGPDGIINNILYISAAQISPHLTRIFNCSLNLSYCPKHFRCSATIALRKPGKGDYTHPKAYRPIALLNTMGKVMDGIMAQRISYVTETHHLLPNTHIGGRKGRSVDHALHTIIEHIYDAWNSPNPKIASLLLLDVSGAFDNVSHERLTHNLRKRRIDERAVKWIESFLSNRSTTISFDGFRSPKYYTSTGIPQGSPLSPILYLFYNADLLEICNREPNTIAIGYIDDIAILKWSRSTDDNCSSLETTMARAQEWATSHASIFAPTKFQLTHHTRRRTGIDLSRSITVEGQLIAPSNSSKYLGLNLDTRLQWKEHIKGIEAKVTKSISGLASLTGSTWGAKLLELRHIYRAVVIPQMTYGSTCWTIARASIPEQPRTLLDCLVRLQKKAAVTISGAYKSTSGAALDTELFLLPITQLLLKTNLQTTSRMLSTVEGMILPPSRPYHTEGGTPRYRSPLQAIVLRMRNDHGPVTHQFETIRAHIVPPWWKGIQTVIAATAAKATDTHNLLAKSTANNILIYTDGSGIDGQIGAAAVSPTIGLERWAYMGDATTSTVHVAELYGIKMAIELALEDAAHGNTRDKIIIFTDNQAAIRMTYNPVGKSGAYVVQDIIDLIDQNAKAQRTSIEIHWVPAHTGIKGNEMADIAAKNAARRSKPTNTQTTVLSPTIYSQHATMKTWIHQHIRKDWASAWAMNPRGRASYRYSPRPTHKTLILHKSLRKWESALLIHMRTEKIGLNDHLWRQKVPETISAQCQCNEGRQTVDHVIMRCRKQHRLRRTFFSDTRNMNLKAILNDPTLAAKATRFMARTHLLGQFRTCADRQIEIADH